MNDEHSFAFSKFPVDFWHMDTYKMSYIAEDKQIESYSFSES